ncbi:3'-5' exonuclease-like [Cornus florida]|uniref:3'-5' exonuclease-like n=1 Tax=Cornus florida TaxID=4283 RepID=UPI00289C2445|nr:3'-5' exonuclease-like [Cornus florida]
MSISIRSFGLTYYSYELYDVTFFDDTIKTLVTNTTCIVDTWISDIKRLHHHRLHKLVVGLDVEWRPVPRQESPVATLQLCVGHNCLIFQILIAPEIPKSLVEFLSNDDFTFVGVKVEDDAQKLFFDYGLRVSRPVDIRSLAVTALNDPGLRNAGLVRLAKDVLGKSFEKPKSVSRSNWDDDWLSEDQIQYACVDAFVSFETGRCLKAAN